MLEQYTHGNNYTVRHAIEARNKLTPYFVNRWWALDACCFADITQQVIKFPAQLTGCWTAIPDIKTEKRVSQLTGFLVDSCSLRTSALQGPMKSNAESGQWQNT